MSDYMDVGLFREKKNGGWYFVKIGTAKDNNKGGLTCWLDALPLPGPDGRCQVSIVPQKERDASSPGTRQVSQTPESRGPVDSFDEIPF